MTNTNRALHSGWTTRGQGSKQSPQTTAISHFVTKHLLKPAQTASRLRKLTPRACAYTLDEFKPRGSGDAHHEFEKYAQHSEFGNDPDYEQGPTRHPLDHTTIKRTPEQTPVTATDTAYDTTPTDTRNRGPLEVELRLVTAITGSLLDDRTPTAAATRVEKAIADLQPGAATAAIAATDRPHKLQRQKN